MEEDDFDDEDEASDDARGAVPLIHSRNSRKRKTQSKASRAQSHGASRGRRANEGHVGQRSKGTGRHMSKGKEKMCTSEDEPSAQENKCATDSAIVRSQRGQRRTQDPPNHDHDDYNYHGYDYAHDYNYYGQTDDYHYY